MKFIVLGIGIAVIAIIAVIMFTYQYVSIQGLRTGYALKNSTNINVVTIGQLQRNATKLPSAIDKQGTNGILIEVLNVKVIGSASELDGDIHIDVSDGHNSLVTEFTPTYDIVGNAIYPQLNQTIDILGVYFCDQAHAAELWHSQKSCAEIHPVIDFVLNGTGIPPGKNVNFTYIPEPYFGEGT
jgi:hypothetical protein